MSVSHSKRKDLVAMCRKSFDFSTKSDVPQSHGSILTTGQGILRGSLRVACDINGPFVSIQGGMKSTGQRTRTAGRRHLVTVPVNVRLLRPNSYPSCPSARSLHSRYRMQSARTVPRIIRIANLCLTSSYCAFSPIFLR